MSNQDKSATGSPTPTDPSDQEAQENLVRCLEGLDQKGEVGLQAALDRIYPSRGYHREPLGPRFPKSHCIVLDQPLTPDPSSPTTKDKPE